MPSEIIDNPPAIEGSISIEIVGRHLNTLHAARTAFVESERLRREITKQIKSTPGPFEMRDKVFFKKVESSE